MLYQKFWSISLLLSLPLLLADCGWIIRGCTRKSPIRDKYMCIICSVRKLVFEKGFIFICWYIICRYMYLYLFSFWYVLQFIKMRITCISCWTNCTVCNLSQINTKKNVIIKYYLSNGQFPFSNYVIMMKDKQQYHGSVAVWLLSIIQWVRLKFYPIPSWNDKK
jgi:hypothetical protein